MQFSKILVGVNNLKNPKNNQNKRISKVLAFSLIELSIVLIIIGLLVAGVTGGASLIQSAKIRAFINEINGYRNAVNIFYASKGRFPGDINNLGKFGADSGYDSYESAGFPAPYDGTKYAIPNRSSAPWVELYLDGAIDFQPTSKTTTTPSTFIYTTANDGGLPFSKVFKDGFFNYEYFSSASTNQAEYRYGLKASTAMTYRNNTGKQTMASKIAEQIDLKFDDGIYNNGIFRGYCTGGDYQTSINNNGGCSILLISWI